MKQKKNVLFIGSFKQVNAAGHVGGQMFAGHSIIHSDLKDKCHFHLLDTTADTLSKRSFIKRAFYAFLRFLKFMRIIATKDIDTVLAFSPYGFGFLEKGMLLVLSKALGKRTIIAPRSGFLMDNIKNSNYFKILAGYILKKSDYIICQGKYWQDFFHTQFGIRYEKLVIIHNWIDPKPYDSKGRKSTQGLQVLFLGWVVKNKGIFDLIPVMEKMRNEPVHWHIAGGGGDYSQLEKTLTERDLWSEVTCYGWVVGEEKRTLLKEADVLVIPSYREGLPNVLLEGIASHCAIIASDVGAVSDIIQEGWNGFLIEPGNPDRIRIALSNYLKDPSMLKMHTQRAFETLLEKCSIEGAVLKLSQLLCG